MSNTQLTGESKMDKETQIVLGRYLKFYNEVNDTSLTVKQACNSPEVMLAFTKTLQYTAHYHDEIAVKALPEDALLPTTSSTKLKSYSLVNIPRTDSGVRALLIRKPDISRYDISVMMGIRLSTICGAVNRLIHNNLVAVSGTKLDLHSNRQVETLVAINQRGDRV